MYAPVRPTVTQSHFHVIHPIRFCFRLIALLGAGLSALTAIVAAPPIVTAPPAPPADADRPVLVWDSAPETWKGLPRNFRTSSDPLPDGVDTPPDIAGLATLRASGSGQFTAANLESMLPRFAGPLTVFDLRQENHALVNDCPVSWKAGNNWANVGREYAHIAGRESELIAGFEPGGLIAISSDDMEEGAPAWHITVETALSERAIVEAAGATYERIPVTDHARPLDSEVDVFITRVRELPPEGWVHFHCKAGMGRTTTFLALYDMLGNAGSVSLEDIVQRQSLLIGDYHILRKARSSKGWKAGLAIDRAEFVRAFYDYARANPGGRPQLWSEWLASQTEVPGPDVDGR